MCRQLHITTCISVSALDHLQTGKEQNSYGMHADKYMCCVAHRRRGSQDVDVSLEVEVDNQPERYTLSASLSAVLGLKQATRASVLQALWAYIKANRLQVCDLPPALLPPVSAYLHTCQPSSLPSHLPACLLNSTSSTMQLPACLPALLSSYL